MEDLAPPLKLVMALKIGIERGESIRTALTEYLSSEADEFAQLVVSWLNHREQGSLNARQDPFLANPYRQGVIFVIERGLAGESIYQNLQQLEEELVEVCQREMEHYVSLLPFKLLMPLLLFQFPAFLILLFGPLLSQFLQGFSAGKIG